MIYLDIYKIDFVLDSILKFKLLIVAYNCCIINLNCSTHF